MTKNPSPQVLWNPLLQTAIIPSGQVSPFALNSIGVVDLHYQDWPEIDGEDVEFRLTYKGILPAQGRGSSSSRSKEKHAIRKQLHGQLKPVEQRIL